MLRSIQTLPSSEQRNSELSVSTLGLLTNAMNICEKVQNVSFSTRLRGELQGHIMTASIILSTMVLPSFPALMGSRLQHPSQLFVLLTDILPWIKRHLIGILVCISLMSNNLSIFFHVFIGFLCCLCRIFQSTVCLSAGLSFYFSVRFFYLLSTHLLKINWHFFPHVICPSQSLDAL